MNCTITSSHLIRILYVQIIQIWIFNDRALLWAWFTWWSPQGLQSHLWLEPCPQQERGGTTYWCLRIRFQKCFVCCDHPLFGSASWFVIHGEWWIIMGTAIVFLCTTSLIPPKLSNVLESIEINKDQSVICDSLMYQIKQSSAADHETPTILYQSISTPNRHFCQFVIDYLSMVLYFDCWYGFLSNSTPAPLSKVSKTVSNFSCINFTCIIFPSLFLWSSFQSIPDGINDGILITVKFYSRCVWNLTPWLLWGWWELVRSYHGSTPRWISYSWPWPIIKTRYNSW